ncbi:C4-dicarboxylate transporter DctM subunit [Scopulibacillus darangshiensis]|uniref:C4-dicarboxylate transporter DctM subunit n=1 Tax=Scopulibacillus darangshiensis TaxID=442528 RepID=A0A4R2NA15_9BACL|nr:TRAP transporter large permease [Scopulibacillus darangshiensis]TCP17903.1 C4-dicarboxylate transporter DctM subunit [Scopulibacillus darangshiensis]
MGTTLLILFGLFAVLILLRVPIAISLVLSSTVMLYLSGTFSLWTIPQKMFTALDSTTLIAIPGFVFAGTIMAKGGIAKYLINTLRAWVGHISGGLSVVTVLACTFFAAISGSSPATAAAIGSIMIPAMVESGYSKRYAMGIVAAAGTIGILIPPSIPLIVYGVVSEQSIGKLFMAGLIPGILMGLLLIVYAIIYARVKGFGKLAKAGWRERWASLVKAVPGIFLPILILGCIYTGITTPTEASILSVFYATIISLFVYREGSLKLWHSILKEGIGVTVMIMLIIASATIFSLYLTQEQIPQYIAGSMLSISQTQVIFFLFTVVLFLILGMFLESSSIMLITLPLLLPIMLSIGVNPIHFAIVMIINMEIAQVTPPVGLNLFVISGVTKESVSEVFKGSLPFILVMFLYMILVMALPGLSLWLPGVL